MDIDRLIKDFEEKGLDRMHFNSWDYRILRSDDMELSKRGYNLIYQGFNNHDCCSQFTIERAAK